MAISSGLRHALSEGASWLCAGAIMVGGVIYHQEIRSSITTVLGIEMPVDDDRAGSPPRTALSDPEQRARAAEARAAEAEARARNAEQRTKGQQMAALQAQARRNEQSRPSYGGMVELKASNNGHFYANADLNGRNIGVLVDTGASAVALTYEDAQRAGIHVSDSQFTGRSQTANGVGRYAPVTIDQISIGSVVVQNVQGVVLERGKSQVTLLGMSFLGKLSRTEMKNGILVLEN
ncbi:MAG: TIGR02281 family clan AA aspartic protease [Hyphomicrobiaceae bacterium]